MFASGMMMMHAGSVAPAGWMLCRGQSLKRAEYPELFAAIGTLYGYEDANHFSIPSMARRFPMGSGTADDDDTKAVLAETHDGWTYLDETHFGNHTHIIQYGQVTVDDGSQADVTGTLGSGAAVTSTDIAAGNEGENAPFQCIPPALTLNFIIKL